MDKKIKLVTSSRGTSFYEAFSGKKYIGTFYSWEDANEALTAA